MSGTEIDYVSRKVYDWYRDRAEWFGGRVATRLANYRGIVDDEYTVDLAKLAAHFGNLVVGISSLRGKQVVVLDARIASAADLSPLQAREAQA